MTLSEIFKQVEDHFTGRKISYDWQIRRMAEDAKRLIEESQEKEAAKNYSHDESISQEYLREKLNGSNGNGKH